MLYSRVALWLILFSLCSVASGRAQSGTMGKADTDCQDSIANCKGPVHYISDQNGCYVFACEYGKPEMHIVRIKEPVSIKALMNLAEKSEKGESPRYPQTAPQAEPPQKDSQPPDHK